MDMSSNNRGLSTSQVRLKRIFDFCLAFFGLLITWWIILLAWFLACVDTQSNGFFIQERIGQGGKLFKLIKIKTMIPQAQLSKTHITQSDDPRITPLGRFFRKVKIDELPQLINVLFGEMSFVGPRPDVPGYADQLRGDDRRILELRPGITGPATLAYRNEEEILSKVVDPIQYNNEVIYPHKVRLNLSYLDNFSLWKDVSYIIKTVIR